MNIVDSENLVGWVKTIKSEQEIAYIREAGKITVRAMDIALENIKEGVAEREVAALVSAQQIRGTDTYGGDSPAIFPIIPSAERTSSAHLTYSPDRSYQKGDVVLSGAGLSALPLSCSIVKNCIYRRSSEGSAACFFGCRKRTFRRLLKKSVRG